MKRTQRLKIQTQNTNSSFSNKKIKVREYTLKSSSKHIKFGKFKAEIVKIFFEILLMIKLYHWNTYIYSSHKASDELYQNINENMDKFIEILLGKTTDLGRIKLTNEKMKLTILNLNDNKLKEKINQFKSYLLDLDENINLKILNMNNDDLFNIRDELLGNLNQFLYLLSLQ